MNFWYKPRLTIAAALLYPLSLIYKSQAQKKYHKDLESSMKLHSKALQINIPVIIVGNITAGGTGKTPMVRFLMRFITAMGFKVGVISRGYGGKYKGVHHLTADDTAELVGDEMAMQYAYVQRQGLTNIEFVVSRDRVAAALAAQELGVDFIIADDGMQHYKLPRHLEIAVIGARGLGNRMFIPAGPLRESPERLQHADFIVNNSSDLSLGGYKMAQFNLHFLPLSAINQPSNPAKLLHILANWQNWLLDSERHDSYVHLLENEPSEQTLEDKYHRHLLAANDLTHLQNKESHSAQYWHSPAFSLNQAMAEVHQTTPILESNLQATKISALEALKEEAIENGVDPNIVDDVVQASQNHFKQTHNQEVIHKQEQVITTTNPISNHAITTYNNVIVTDEEEVFVPALPEAIPNFKIVSDDIEDTSTTTTSAPNAKNNNHQIITDKLKTPTFKNADEFLSFINKQLDPKALSYEVIVNKAKAFLSEQSILIEQMQATFPKVVALCAIGYPESFKTTLEEFGFEVIELFSFKDHHQFKQTDIDKIYQQHPEYKEYPLLVTEKDAIKLKELQMPDNCFFLEREGYFDTYTSWLDRLKDRLIQIYTNLNV